MKRIMMVMLLTLSVVLSGCRDNSATDKIMQFREQLLTSNGYVSHVNITADYGDMIYTFALDCTFDSNGSMTFEILSPESICGITGSVSKERGSLTFDEQVLLFELIADGQLTPISAPWHVFHSLRSGYIASAGVDGQYMKILLDDSYDENALNITFWFTENMIPVDAEIYWKNRRILTLDIVSFSYL